MKRIVFAFFLAGFAAAALASPNDGQHASTGSTASMASAPEGSVWTQDHNFTAPPQ